MVRFQAAGMFIKNHVLGKIQGLLRNKGKRILEDVVGHAGLVALSLVRHHENPQPTIALACFDDQLLQYVVVTLRIGKVVAAGLPQDRRLTQLALDHLRDPQENQLVVRGP